MKRIRKIKYIKVNPDLCNGCRMCETMCAAFHAEPKYSVCNQKRSRIRIFWCEENNMYIPIRAGKPTDVECIGRMTMTIDGKDYGECSFCRQICPSRDLFFQPDNRLPLECDMCGEPMPEEGPLCVQWCKTEALVYEEKEIEEEVEEEDDEIGWELL